MKKITECEKRNMKEEEEKNKGENNVCLQHVSKYGQTVGYTSKMGDTECAL